MIYAPYRTLLTLISIGFISCTIQDSSTAQLGQIAKQYQKNGNLLIDKAMADSQGHRFVWGPGW